MQTEPIGFKGTPGEWYFEMHNPEVSRYFGNIISNLGTGDNGIKNIRTMTIQLDYVTEEENVANTKLMVASKAMAVALQEVMRNHKMDIKEYEMCVMALSHAGLI